MNNKITFPRLATMLADKSGRTKRFSEDFLREFFSLISESLEKGETVKVKGLGTFRLSRVEPRKSVDVTTGEPMEISGHTKVVFVPAKEMAEAVNTPFEAFSAVEIGDDIDIDAFEKSEFDDQLQSFSKPEIEEEIKISEIHEPTTEVTITDISESSDMTDKSVESDTEDMSQDETDRSDIAEISDNKENTGTMTISGEQETEKTFASEQSETQEDSEPYENHDYDDNYEPSRRHWLKGFLSGIGAAILIIAIATGCWLYFAKPDLSGLGIGKPDLSTDKIASAADSTLTADSLISDNTKANTVDETKNKEINSFEKETQSSVAERVPTTPSDKIVYDTIGKTRYLTTMAKAHYGNYNLWPYIYEENKAFLRHPDRIRPGTPVVVPSLSKYGVDPKNPKDIETAKKLGIEIYGRYKKDL